VTVLYRLVKAARRAHAFSGEGARLKGGRWNPPGYAVVYAAQSRALAVLEALVHLPLEARRMRYLIYEVTLPGKALVTCFKAATSSGWRHLSVTAASQEAGRNWIEDGKALAFAVPSVLVPQEMNYVLSVRHPQFADLRISPPEPFAFDERLW